MAGRDANHGNCAQPCRWNYSLREEKRPGQFFPVFEDERGTYIFNSKDMCLIEHIPELAKAGIDSFKIEGRVKTAYYAAVITNAYRRAVDLYDIMGDKYVLPQCVLDEVNKVSHREYFTGFYFGEKDSEYREDAKYIRTWDVCAYVQDTNEENLCRAVLKNKFSKGDRLELLSPGQDAVSFTAEEIYDKDMEAIDSASHPQMEFYLRLPVKAGGMAIIRKQNQL